ncbi:MAG: type III pantothenate kinase [Candidatus Omnitrophica bacterium]|nr:type III pantothenate kinase [Candidatus Omnitrophota bacterium]
MLLAVDIGNTNISFGIFKANRIIKRFDICGRNYERRILKKKIAKFKLDGAVICSVVPYLTAVIKKDIKRLLGINPFILGKDIRVPIKNLYRNPRGLGQDRLVNAYAGINLHRAPLIIIDLGTAITFDIISKDKTYLGGLILPGLRLSIEALSEKTALLPKIRLERPKEFIGGDTKSCILSGVLYGYATMIEGLSKKIKERLGGSSLIIGTGGDIRLLRRYCRIFDKIDKDLTLKGLNLIYHHLCQR